MDLIDGLKAFVATAQTGSFTEAAERLGISNRLTSKYVAQLEEKLGARLLQRTTRQVSLTAAGQELLSRAPILLNQLDDMLVLVSEESKGLTGTLRISAPVTFGEVHLQDMLRRFSAIHPDISLDLRLTDQYVDLASDGFDLAFRVGMPTVSSLKARKLGELKSHLVASPEYLKRCGEPKHPNELDGHDFVIDTNRQQHNKWSFKHGNEEFVFSPTKKLMVNSARIVRDWTLAGCGIALCPDFVIRDELKSGQLTVLLDQYQLESRTIYATYLSGHEIPRKVRALIDFAVEDFQQHSAS
ncbi:LysR family transcriptional regulator [Vibrio hepatarius]|uniref:LysR family transcriptional regulator n=1 Tax=Vibrio hepatarius TaxID=171383 RepID=UPI00148E2AF5|nr:LysR family transcriptional regulator [Vibrio hepatarius]NOI14292.1 LysR family transcriptional regulator [Vibrio hepatarius]